jgi:hypothetical protein
MEYRCEAKSFSAFVQRVAVGCVANGYFRYVIGTIPDRKEPSVVDKKMIEKFELTDKSARHRRKMLGLANVQYVRHKRKFGLAPIFDTSS